MCRGQAQLPAADMSVPLFSGQSLGIHNRLQYARSDRGDRDRFVTGKRDAWGLERASPAPPYHQRTPPLSSANGAPLGPPSKRRPPGRHTFYGENGRHGGPSSRADSSPMFGPLPSAENAVPRKYDRDTCYAPGASSISATSFNGSGGSDYRHKDSRDPYVLSGDARDSASPAVIDHLSRAYHPQLFSDCSGSWDRDKPKATSGWDAPQRGDRDHRLRGKSDLYKRSASFQHSDWSSGERDLDIRPDRYGSSRESLFSDGGTKDSTTSTHDWKPRERSFPTSTWSCSFSASNGGGKDLASRQHHGPLELPALISSPQHSPFSSPTSVNAEGVRDDGNFSSPRKRPRLGWGQGLAKYEKKKVVSDEGVVASATGAAPPTELQPAGEKLPSPVSQVAPDLPPSTPVPSSASTDLPQAGAVVDEPAATETAPDTTVDDAATVVSQPHAEGFDSAQHPVKFPESTEPGQILENQIGLCSSEPDVSTQHLEVILRNSPYVKATVGDTLDGACMQDPRSSVKEELPSRSKDVDVVSDSVDIDMDQSMDVDTVAGSLTHLERATCREGEELVPGSEASVKLVPAIPTTEMAFCEAAIPQICVGDSAKSGHARTMVDAVSTGDNLKLDKSVLPVDAANVEGGGHEHIHVYAEDGPGMVAGARHQEDAHTEIVSSLLSEEVAFSKPSKARQEARLEAYESSVKVLFRDNRESAASASEALSHLLAEGSHLGRDKLYSSPAEASVWQANVVSHKRIMQQMQEKILEHRHSQALKEKVLAIRFRACKEVWSQEHLGSTSQRRDRAKSVRKWEVERKNGSALCQRSSLRLRTTPSGAVRPDAAAEEIQAVRKLMSEPIEQFRIVQRMPAMILDEKERYFRTFITKNGLVEDPVKVEQERKHINPWTIEEKKLFMEKFALYSKDFKKIASYFDHKSTADCVQFYYRNQKSEDFDKIRRRQEAMQLKKRRDYSRSSASYLATTTPASNRHKEANAVRVEALTMAVATASVSAGVRDPVKSVRSVHKPVDRAKSCNGGDVVTTECAAGTRSVTVKESKAATDLLAVAAGSPGFGGIACSLSSATTVPKNYRERLNAKAGAAVGISPARNGNVDHQSGPKGVRSIQVRRESMRATAEEVESQWSEQEQQLFTDALATVGKDFKSISLQVGTKTQGQCRAFYSKSRKRLGLDQVAEQAEAMLLTTLPTADADVGVRLPVQEVTVRQECPVKEAVEMPAADALKMEDSTTEVLDSSAATEVQVMEVEGVLQQTPIPADGTATDTDASSNCKVEGDVMASSAHAFEAVPQPATVEAVEDFKVKEEGTGTTSVESVKEETATPLESETKVVEEKTCTEAEVTCSQSCPIVHSVEILLKEEAGEEKQAIVSEAIMGELSMDGPPKSDAIESTPLSCVAEVTVAALVEPLGSHVAVKPEPESPSTGISFVSDSACTASVRPANVQPTPPVVTVPPVPVVKGLRGGLGGESKPRREPTSWTQEEKEKFAEIIRKHGKDWGRLHESLPAKSLTQIKTYFQNSKAKLGFAPPEGTGQGGRGGGSRKRKADDSDTGSNAGSAGQMLQQKGAGLSEDSSMKLTPSAIQSAESLAYALFGRPGGLSAEENVSSLHKLLRHMLPSGFPQQSGLFPLYHPLFSMQRAAQLSLQQQQLSQSAAQLPQQMGSSHPQGLQQAGVSQALLQQQVAHMHHHPTAQALARKQQMQQIQQSAQVMGVPQAGHLNLDVQHVLQKAQAAQSQQVLGQAPPQGQGQPQGQLSSQPQGVMPSQHQIQAFQQQYLNHAQQQVALQQSQNPALHLQPFQQAAQQMHQDQGAHHVMQGQFKQVGKLQLQKQQGQSQQHQPAVQLQLHHLDQQQQVEQQMMLQQLHHGSQPLQSLLREALQAQTPHGVAELNIAQAEVDPRNMAPHLRQLPRVEEVQLSGHVSCSLGKDGDQSRSGVASGADGLLPQNMRPGDVKLFGQSLLTQPSSSAPMQPVLPPRQPAGNVSERPVQSTSFVNSSASHSVASIQTSACMLPNTSNYKEPGSLSSFGRAGTPLVSAESRHPSWPNVLANNVGMWTSMLGSVQGGGATGIGEPASQSAQEAVALMTERVSREARQSEENHGGHGSTEAASSASHTSPPVKAQIDQLRRLHAEMQRDEGFASLDPARTNILLDQPGSLLGGAEADRRHDVNSNGSVDRPGNAGLVIGRNGRATDLGVTGALLTAGSSMPGTAQLPRQVVDALMAIAEWQSRTQGQFVAAAAAAGAAQGRSSVNNDAAEIHSPWAGEPQGFRRESFAGANPVSPDAVKTTGLTNPSAALAGLAAAAAASMGQTHLVTVPEVLQHVRDSGMYFAPPAGHSMHVPGASHVGISNGTWGCSGTSNGQGGVVLSDSQQRILLQPITSSFRGSGLPTLPWGIDEHLRPPPCNSESSGRDSSVEHHTSS